MVEALAQISAGILLTLPQYKGKLALFASIEGVRFKRLVTPGDRLDMYCEMVKLKGSICKTACKAEVDGQLAVTAELMCSIQ